MFIWTMLSDTTPSLPAVERPLERLVRLVPLPEPTLPPARHDVAVAAA
jgi:hypothetical protein